jgi:hypothetical protein
MRGAGKAGGLLDGELSWVLMNGLWLVNATTQDPKQTAIAGYASSHRSTVAYL